MSEPMTTWAEGVLFAADAGGVWACTGGFREPVAVYADGDPWFTVKLDLATLGVIDPTDDLFNPPPHPDRPAAPRPSGAGDLVFLHGTSGRPDNGRYLVTHAAVTEVAGGDVLEVWPNALPVTPELLAYVGKPFPHGPTTAAVPRDVDVIWHAAGHLAYLRDTNAAWQDVLASTPSGRWWRAWLDPIAPVLAKQYTRAERAAWREAHPAVA